MIERNNLNRRRQFERGTLINLCHTKQASSSDTIDINLLVEDNRVITVHWGEIEAITKINSMLKKTRNRLHVGEYWPQRFPCFPMKWRIALVKLD